MVFTHKQQFNKRHGFDKDEPHSKQEIGIISKIPMKIIDQVYDRGVGAYRTAGANRPNMTPQSWGQARIYAFVNKVEKGVKMNQDIDLFKIIKK